MLCQEIRINLNLENLTNLDHLGDFNKFEISLKNYFISVVFIFLFFIYLKINQY